MLTTDLLRFVPGLLRARGARARRGPADFREDAACRELLIGFETGALTEERFETELAPYLGVDSLGLIDRLFAGSAPDHEMVEAVRRARAGGVRTGLVSNSWGTRRYPRDLLGELFDGVVISGEVGIRKPAPEMYRLGAERIGVEAEACVFVDDLPFNLSPAADLGMSTIHHRSAQETIGELERLLGVSLR